MKPQKQWWTVIVRYDDAPQTCADWYKATSPERAIQLAHKNRGEDGKTIAVLSGRVALVWTPEDAKAEA